MKGYYWKHPDTGEWFWRENKKTNDFRGPYSSFRKAQRARAEYYDRKLTRRVFIHMPHRPAPISRKPVGGI